MVFWFALSKLLLISWCTLVAVNAKEHRLYSSGSSEALLLLIHFLSILSLTRPMEEVEPMSVNLGWIQR